MDAIANAIAPVATALTGDPLAALTEPVNQSADPATVPAAAEAGAADTTAPAEVVKRGRGRPPGSGKAAKKKTPRSTVTLPPPPQPAQEEKAGPASGGEAQGELFPHPGGNVAAGVLHSVMAALGGDEAAFEDGQRERLANKLGAWLDAAGIEPKSPAYEALAELAAYVLPKLDQPKTRSRLAVVASRAASMAKFGWHYLTGK